MIWLVIVISFCAGYLLSSVLDLIYVRRLKQVHFEELRQAAMAARRAVLEKEGDL